MKIRDIINHLEEMAPIFYSEDFDNTGLLTGEETQDLTGILVTLDALEEVVDEAILKKCNLIVSFHPILFSGIKKLRGDTYVERSLIKAIQNNIAIYALHTALDNAFYGVNYSICEALNLKNKKILIPKENTLRKLITYVPHKNSETLRNALFASGAGSIGNYSNCSFNIQGVGTFRGNDNSKPFVGNKNTTHTELETLISCLYPIHREQKILKALKENHPYEEVAYDIISLENVNPEIGMGMVGELEDAADEKEFMQFLKQKMQAKGIRHSKFIGKKIKKVAVLGGSGSFAIDAAKRQSADIFISSDIKYHQYYQAENKMIIADIGHYESEQFIKNYIVNFLKEKITKFAVILSDINTNPVNYL